MNQTNLHYINCGNQFVDATGDGINQVQCHLELLNDSFLPSRWAMLLLCEVHAVLHGCMESYRHAALDVSTQKPCILPFIPDVAYSRNKAMRDLLF